MKKFIWILLAVLVLGLGAFVFFRFYFVFGEGVRSGELNYVVYKGVIWKTYEGKLIQTGIKAQTTGVQSNTFEFSVADKEIAERLMMESGKVMDLHYKEYFGRLPWRGHTRYIVDDIVSIREKNTSIDDQNTEVLSTIAPGTEGNVIPGLY
ncbi:MAG: hypothetical protein IJQ69_03115 [Bacteroidales bacterium]|nr:hypothetical protein [Bacteroidales bacterium]